jgi:hypothetical protein
LEKRKCDEVQAEVRRERQRRRQVDEEEAAQKAEQRQWLVDSFGKMINTIKQKIDEFNRE